MDTNTCGCSCACEAPPAPVQAAERTFWRSGGWLLAALPAGAVLYASLEALARWLTFGVLGLAPGSRLGEAVAFFAYDAPKVLLLLAVVVLGVSFAQTFIRPERVRDLLARRTGAWGNLLAALLGIATPFCSCSAVPLFLGFVRVGVPLGTTFSFLVSAPMVNEVALFLLLSLFGWRIALVYTVTGLAVAFLSGWLISKFRMERHLESWVMDAPFEATAAAAGPVTLGDRFGQALQATRDIVGKVWLYVLAGIAVGAFLHGYVPAEFLARFMGKSAWWSVPLAVLIGVPLYASAAGIIPIVQVLLAKGAALGTALAFMMAVAALSLPEAVILRRVMRPRLLGAFLGIVTLGIVLVGYLFNLLM
jgi:uncharacterized membrane protein YraQ (UPF0718 family)